MLQAILKQIKQEKNCLLRLKSKIYNSKCSKFESLNVVMMKIANCIIVNYSDM